MFLAMKVQKQVGRCNVELQICEKRLPEEPYCSPRGGNVRVLIQIMLGLLSTRCAGDTYGSYVLQRTKHPPRKWFLLVCWPYILSVSGQTDISLFAPNIE